MITAGELAARMVASALASGEMQERETGALVGFPWFPGSRREGAQVATAAVVRRVGGHIDTDRMIDALARDIERQRAAVTLGIDPTAPRTSGA